MDQNAEAGLPHGGFRRPFGYDDDKISVREDEAQIVRTLAERYLAGESLRSLAVWLDDQGVRTVAGGTWRSPTLRAMLAQVASPVFASTGVRSSARRCGGRSSASSNVGGFWPG